VNYYSSSLEKITSMKLGGQVLKYLTDIVATLKEGRIRQVCIALNWTVVVVEVDGDLRCGLAATMHGRHEHRGEPQVPQAGSLVGKSTSELISFLGQMNSPRTSLAMATLNALIPPQSDTWKDGNAVEIIASQGRDKMVALIGHFPFVDVLRERLDNLVVIDQNPQSGDYPEQAAPQFLPQADLIAMTSMTLMNGTFESLMALRQPNAAVMLLGPSTPLSPVMFDYGVEWLSGAIVEDIPSALAAASQGGNFRQVRRAGVRLITKSRP
jgi:uncharacterized protein